VKEKKNEEKRVTTPEAGPTERARRARRPKPPAAEVGVALSTDGTHAMVSVVADVLPDAEAQGAIRARLLGVAALMLPPEALCVPGVRAVCWLSNEPGKADLVAEALAGLLDRVGYEVAMVSSVSDLADFEARR
jgi:hypothetical protein